MPESLGGINDLKGENHTILLPKEACAKSNTPLRHSREGGNDGGGGLIKAVLCCREGAIFDRIIVGFERRLHAIVFCQEVANKFGLMAT